MATSRAGGCAVPGRQKPRLIRRIEDCTDFRQALQERQRRRVRQIQENDIREDKQVKVQKEGVGFTRSATERGCFLYLGAVAIVLLHY